MVPVPGPDTSIESTWRRIRALRHSPPSAANRGKRRQVFAAALEQAEQLFRASAAVGSASRPLTLFYGLSQAGRAIAAARAVGASWQLRGHGIRVDGLGEGLLELRLMDHGKGSFTQLASILSSPSLSRPVTLSEVWSTLPETQEHPLPGVTAPVVLNLWPERTDTGWSLALSPNAEGWLCGLPPSLLQEPDPKQAIRRYMNHFPTAAGWEFPNGQLQHAPARGWGMCVRLRWLTDDSNLGRNERDRQARLRELAVPYGDDDVLWVPPALPGATQPLHPLLAWWAALYGLSMLARYEPAPWIEQLDVNRSPFAVSLEAMLDGALEACPKLVLLALAPQPN